LQVCNAAVCSAYTAPTFTLFVFDVINCHYLFSLLWSPVLGRSTSCLWQI